MGRLSLFWVRVGSCDHANAECTGHVSTCSTPYCGAITESHCPECHVYITACACGANAELDGWSAARRRAAARRKHKEAPDG